jgi:MYND finger/Ankyrin repeat
VNVRCGAGTTPLMHARTAAVAKLLLAAGADASAVDRTHWTMLHHDATVGASAGAVCLVLKAGADPTAVDRDGSTAAHLAGIKGHFTLEALLSRAADDYRKKQTVATTSNSSSSTRTGDSSTAVAVASAVSNAASSGSGSTAAVSANDAKACLQQAAVTRNTTATEQQQQCKPLKTKQPCANCSKRTTKRCKRCAAVYYCSAVCQKCVLKTQSTEHSVKLQQQILSESIAVCTCTCSNCSNSGSIISNKRCRKMKQQCSQKQYQHSTM